MSTQTHAVFLVADISGYTKFMKYHEISLNHAKQIIVVHRMLKNSVPSNEYIMMSDTAYKNFSDFYGLKPKTFRENFEGIGELDTQVFFADDIFKLREVPMTVTRKPSFKERIG